MLRTGVEGQLLLTNLMRLSEALPGMGCFFCDGKNVNMSQNARYYDTDLFAANDDNITKGHQGI